MKPTPAELLMGLVLAIVSAVLSPAVMIGLGGLAMCGSPLNLGVVGVAVLLAAILPAVTARFLRGFWPLAFLSFSWALLWISVLMLGWQIEWDRMSAILGCILLSIASAWKGACWGASNQIKANESTS